MIPRTLHYFWDGPNPIPDRVKEWPAMFPGWSIRRLTTENVIHPMKEQLVELGAWATLSDVARVQALVMHGGVSVDTGFEFLKPLEPLLISGKPWVCVEGHSTIANGIMASPRMHPFFREIAWHLVQYDLVGIAKARHCNVAGPVLVSKVYRDIIGQWPETTCEEGFDRSVVILPKRYFYHHAWYEEYREPHADSYGAHVWEKQWFAK